MEKMSLLVAILSIIVVASKFGRRFPRRVPSDLLRRPIIVHFDQVRIRQYPNLTIGGVSNSIQTRTTDRLSFANAGRFPFPRLLARPRKPALVFF